MCAVSEIGVRSAHGRGIDGRIGFTAIHEITAQTMAAHVAAEVATLEAVRAVDAWARQYAAEIARGLRLKGSMKSEV